MVEALEATDEIVWYRELEDEQQLTAFMHILHVLSKHG